MTRRTMAGGMLVLAAVTGAAYLGAQFAFSRTAFAKPKAEAKPMPALRAGYVAMAEVMSGSKKWQDRAKKATAVREEAAKKLGVLQASAQQLQQKAQKATGEEQEKLALELREVSRKLEDSDRTLRAIELLFGAGHEAVLQGEQGDHRFHTAGRTQRVAGGALGRAARR